MSGTSTVTSESTLLTQLSRQPRAYSSSEMCRVRGESSSPESSFTRHLPQAPLPEQGASMATLARCAAASRLSPTLALICTWEPLTMNVIDTMLHPPEGAGMCPRRIKSS